MLIQRPVRRVAKAHKQREGGGFVVRRPVGGAQGYTDPFLMLDHLGPVTYGPGEAIGAPPHPHRGFETVTYILQGSSVHKDSHGNTGELTDGWVQWMTAGSGIVHSEMPSQEFFEKGGKIEGFQLWVNLPAKDKMTKPRYQDTPPEKMPVLENNQVFVKVIAGEATLDGKTASSPIETRSPIMFVDARLKMSDAVYGVNMPKHFDGFVYCYRGQGTINGQDVAEGQAAVFEKTACSQENQQPPLKEQPDLIELSSGNSSDFRVLVICGEPLREPVFQHGPFVMSTKEEIVQTLRDMDRGDFGTIDGGDEQMKMTQLAKMKQKQSGRWHNDNEGLVEVRARDN